MTLVALTNFITITGQKVVNNRRRKLQRRYQNGKTGGTVTLDNKKFGFLSFIYQGATKNRTGDNMEATLVLANNQLSMNTAIEAVRGRWQIQVDTCTMNPDNLAVLKKITTENWIVSTMSYDPVTIEITLSSSIDAVGANVPNRVLTQKQVGALPTTAQLQNR